MQLVLGLDELPSVDHRDSTQTSTTVPSAHVSLRSSSGTAAPQAEVEEARPITSGDIVQKPDLVSALHFCLVRVGFQLI